MLEPETRPVSPLETTDAFASVGFEVVEAELAPDAWVWWEEYCYHGCREAEAQVILEDGGRWISFGYVIARKPEEPTTPCT